MASLALHGVKEGSKYIPDAAFENIPVVGPRYFKEDQRQDAEDRKNQRRRDRSRREREYPQSDSDSYDSDQDSDNDRERRARRSYRRSAREQRRNHHRGYDSDPQSPPVSRGNDVRSGGYQDAPRGYDNSPYFPPPPKIAIGEPIHQPEDRTYTPRPYNPAEYNQNEGQRDGYYSGHPQEQAPYTPPPGPPPAQRAAYQQPPVAAGPQNPNAYHRSSVADRYRPSSYDSYDRDISPGTRDGRGSPRPNYPSAVAIRPPSDYYASQDSLSPTYNRYDDDDEDDRHRHRRRSSKGSRSRSKSRGSRSRSRVGEAGEKVKDEFEKHKGELGAGALGAVAGGLLGREFGGKKGNLGMIIGAALGGVGAGLYGKHQEKQRARSRSMPRREYAGYESY